LKLGHVLALHGGWGLFAISFLESSFIPFPGVNDLALIVLASKYPARATLYAMMSTAGSLLGSYVTYSLARWGGRWARRKVRTSAEGRRSWGWLERNDFVAMLVMCLLPPPAPLKLFVISMGALRINALHFGAAFLVGRVLRFGAEAWLGAHYGVQAQAYLKKNLTWASLVAIALIIGLTVLFRWWKRRQAATSQ
jgi:membrane protein YqaA with SNARE-associated domain